ncbi:MAG: sarcosine oxidase subunit gamma [Acidimicrobiia bacterium]
MAETLTLTDWTAMDKVLVHAPAAGSLAGRLGVGFGRAQRRGDGTLVVRVQPGQWLLFAPPGRAPELVEEWQAAAGDEFVSVLDVTSGRALFRLTGDAGPALLAKVCALDLERAPDGSAQRSSVAEVNAEIVRDDAPAGRRSFLIACDRSFGRYLFRALADAGAEFSIHTLEGGT